MKPNKKQKEIIDVVISIIKTWKNTNDITSPTHYCDITELLNGDLYDLPGESIEAIDVALTNILWEVKKYGNVDSKK